MNRVRPPLLGVAALALAACLAPSPGDPLPLDAPIADAGPDLLAWVGEPLTLDGSGSVGAVAAAWATGDGGALEGLTGEVTYLAPGHYTAALTVTGADGRTASDTLTVEVAWRPLPSPPAAASTLAATDDGRLLVVLPDHDLLAVVDLAARAVTAWVETCHHPRRVAVGGAVAAVACDEGPPAVWRYDLTDPPTLRDALDLGAVDVSPTGLVVDPEGRLHAVARRRADADGLLLSWDASGARSTRVVGGDLRGLAAFGDELLLTRWRSPDGQGAAWLIGQVTAPITLPAAPGPDSDTQARGVPGLLEAVAVRPDGRVAAVGGVRANVARGLARDGLPLTHETTARADLRLIDVAAGSDHRGAQVASARLDNRDRVTAVAWDPRGAWLYVAYGGGERVDVLDGWAFTLAASVGDLGHEPRGLWASPDRALLVVDASLSRQLTLVDVSDPSLPAVIGAIDLQPPSGEPLDPKVLAGAVVFHRAADPRMSRDGYIACASCHPDGEDDGHTWDFTDRGEGLRRTTSLRGLVDRPGPIHWSGNFNEIQDFEADIRGPQQGLGFLDDAHWRAAAGPSLGEDKAGLSDALDALAAYVLSLGPLDVPATPPPARGAEVFELGGCAACHPAGGTDSAWLDATTPRLHDVGTLTAASGGRLGGPLPGLDTPTLQGTWAHTTWLHDGRATSLADVLATADGAHGDLTWASPEDLAALEAWLRAR